MKKYLLSICMLGLLLGLAMPSKAACNSLEEECLNETALVKVKAEEAKEMTEEKMASEVALVKKGEETNGDKKVLIEEMPAGGDVRVKTSRCEAAGYVWDAERGKCVPDPTPSCRKGQVVVNGKCVDEATSVPEKNKINIPSLQHFDLTGSEVEKDYIFLQFAPKGTPHFYLNVQLETVDGKDELSAWCTGDESLCKAVGNGQECGSDLPTGSAAWCYLNEEEKPRDPITGPICEDCKKKIE